MTATLLIAVLPLIGLGLCFWALIREPLVILSVVTGWALFMLYLSWIV